jgi:hypothetical protein
VSGLQYRQAAGLCKNRWGELRGFSLLPMEDGSVVEIGDRSRICYIATEEQKALLPSSQNM